MRRGMQIVAAWAVVSALAGCSGESAYFGEAVDPPGDALALSGLNWNGEPFRLDSLRGRVTVVFFGYTFCPDVCPFTLAKMKQVYAELGDDSAEVAVVFVSVDPRRDTVEKLGRYVPAFDERFFGLALDDEELAAARERFGVTVRYGPPQGANEQSYFVDHTGTYFVIDRQGRLRLRLPPDAKGPEIAHDVARLLAAERGERS